MGDFTDSDRETQVKTLTTLEMHVKLSDERHKDITKIISDHEKRIRKNEGIVKTIALKVAFIFTVVGTVFSGALYAIIRKLS